jgi:hypothetical protein
MSREKMISFTLRGFDFPAQEVASLIDVAPSRIGHRGEPVRPYVKTLLVRSYVQYAMRFEEDHLLCDMLPNFLIYLGGVEHLLKVQDQVKPEFSEFHLDLPVKQSIESQEGYFSSKDIVDIARLNATISLGFF